jgi:ankyrin repeat protein
LDARNKDGCTALYLAVQSGHVAVAQYLVKNAGSDLNIASNGQWSVLGVAVDKTDKQLLNTIIAGSISNKQTAPNKTSSTTNKVDGCRG